MPIISNTPLSNCCYAGVSVYPGGEETNQYVCKDCKEPCDIHSDDALTGNESWWRGAKYAYDEESGCGCDGTWRTVYNITGILAEQQRRDWEEFRQFLKDQWIIKADKVMKQKPIHGPCCTCQECGFSHSDGDECYCKSNELNELIDAKLSSLSNPEEEKV